MNPTSYFESRTNFITRLAVKKSLEFLRRQLRPVGFETTSVELAIPMLTLGIETSGRAGTVALWREGSALGARELPPVGRRHAQSLIVELATLLKENDLRPDDVEAVAVSIGPGSFTGLRIGVVCAKTFAYATGCRLAVVETFAASAAASPTDVDDLHVIADAQRGDLYTARYERGADGFFVRSGEMAIIDFHSWCRARSVGDVISGPGIDRFEAELPPYCRLLPPESRYPSAIHVAQLGQRGIRAGNEVDPWSLEPFYLRKSAAEETWDARDQGPSGTGSC